LGRCDLFWPLLLVCHFIVHLCPVLAYIALSLATSGRTGLRTYEP
jgi:hypothetical protein